MITYTRDAAGRISAAAMTGGTTPLASGIARRADGQPARIVYGNNLTETRTYGPRGELTGQQLTGNLLGELTASYLYDPSGNLLAARTAAAASPSLYAFDALDRLTGETGMLGGQLDYRYDAAGNRLELTGNGDEATNKAWVLGSDRFKQRIQAKLDRRVEPKAKGGDRKSEKFRINRV